MKFYARLAALIVVIVVMLSVYLFIMGAFTVHNQLVASAPTTDPMAGMMMMGTMSPEMAPISGDKVPDATQDVGGQPLTPRIDNGVKVFELTAEAVRWKILNDVSVIAWTYNGTVPGPMIHVTEGDKVRVILKNTLPEPTTIHWHGIQVPNNMDGVPDLSQKPIEPGQSFTYEFTAGTPGTYMYHTHYDDDKQMSLGLYAPFIIDPKDNKNKPDVDVLLMLSEWRVVNGQTFAAMPMAAMEPNYFTINGKSAPSTPEIEIKKGQRVRLRFYGVGQLIHPMHLHGFPFKLVATDGHDVPEAAQMTMDTISVAPGQRFDVEFVADQDGKWLLHCHIAHHLTNDDEGAGMGGLTIVLNVTDSGASSSTGSNNSPSDNPGSDSNSGPSSSDGVSG
jgi:FtsP/CotA-like multicopper oxidase with cupredoxin domain